MKLADIKKIDRSKLPNEDFKTLYDEIKEGTGGFDEEFIELFDSEIKEFLTAVKKYVPEALTETVKRVRQPRKKTEKPIDFEDDDVVETVMDDYNLTRDKAVKLIALRKEAYELKKENLDKLLDRLDKSEFYQGKNSNAPIDKGRTRDLGKDSKQGSITLAEERKMTKTPFKRISKEGRKNQYGTTEGGNVYYEYRMNRRDVDKKIKLETGGMTMIPSANVYMKSTADFSDEGKKRAGKYVIKAWNTGQTHGMIFSPNEKWNTFLTNNRRLEDEGWKRIDWSEVPKEALMTFYFKLPFDMKTSFSPYYEPLPEMKLRIKEDGTIYKNGGGVGIPNSDKMFHLPYEIAVYVPSTKDVDKNITTTELRARVKEVEKYLAETFGGFTSAEKVGGYLSSKSSVVTEKVIPVTAFATMQSFRDNKAKLVNKMSVWAKKWGQEAIGFEFEGDLYYVPQKFKTGGKLKATYIPKSDIKTLTTVWGNNIKGKDLLDGAYTIRKDIKKQPKMVRSMFEEMEFSEFKTGGGIPTKMTNEEIINYLKKYKFAVIRPLGISAMAMDKLLFVSYGRQMGYIRFLENTKKEATDGLTELHVSDAEGGQKLTGRVIELTPDKIYDIIMQTNYMYSKFEKGGKTKPKDPVIVRGFADDEAYEYETGGGIPTDMKIQQMVDHILNEWDKEDLQEIGISEKDLNTLSYEKLSDKVIKAYGWVLDTDNNWSKKDRQMYLDEKVDGMFYDIFGDDEEQYAKGGKPKMVRYYFEDEEYEYAKGGMTAHGLKRGDTIVDDMFWENKIVVKSKDGKRAMINLETGLRTEEK